MLASVRSRSRFAASAWSYALMISALCANYAEFIDSGIPSVLDSRAFATHLVDVISAALCAPDTVAPEAR